MCLTTLLPFFILLTCDIIISKSLIQAASASTLAPNAESSNTTSVQKNNSRLETAKRTTIMILAVSVAFLILTLPKKIVVTWFNSTSENMTAEQYAEGYLMIHACTLLVTTNSAINFYLYCLTGNRFRQEFLRWIFCRWRCCPHADDATKSPSWFWWVVETASIFISPIPI